MKAIQVRSPAKVNLFLRVIRRRRDGFHDIETLFEKIDLCDEIRLEVHKRGCGIQLYTSSKEIPSGRGNLAFKAASLFLKRFKIRQGVKINLKKRIPVSAGLGGGSSNAASVLLAMAQAFELKEKGALQVLAQELGSDVPFFMQDTPFAIGRGRGNIISPFGLRGQIWHILVYPKIHISSRCAYIWNDQTKGAPLMRLTNIRLGDKIFSLRNLFFNELESAVAGRFGVITKMKEALRSFGVVNPIMSGSGSAVFGCLSDRESAIKVAQGISRKFPWQVYVARTFNSSIWK